MRFQIAIMAALMAGLACPALGAEGQSSAKALVAAMPAEGIAAGRQVAADIVKLGPDGIRQIVDMLVTPGEGDDAKARFALNGVAMHVTRPGAEAERAMLAEVLVQAIEADKPVEVKRLLVGMLQLVGKDESIAALEKLLTHQDLGEPATRALVQIGSDKAKTALLTALPAAKNAQRVSIIQGLGDLRYKPAAAAIMAHAGSDDVNTRQVALVALANIGDPSSDEVLAKAANAQGRFERMQATNWYLLYAQRLAEDGNKARCAAICRELVKSRTAERNIVAGALRTLVLAHGNEAMADVLAAVDSDDKQLRIAAMELTQLMPGEAATAQMVAKMKQVSGERRGEIVGALGQRNDPAAAATVLEAIKDQDKAARMAATVALGRKPSAESIAALLAAIQVGQPDEVKLIQETLTRIPGPEVLATAAGGLAKGTPGVRVALLEILATRRATAHTETVFALTSDREAAVKTAAIRTLGDIGDGKMLPRMIDLLLNAPIASQQDEAQKAIVAICRRMPEGESRVRPVLLGLNQATGSKRAALLRVLSQIGGPWACEAVMADTNSGDAEVADAAIRALADWPDGSAIPSLLKLAQSTQKPNHRILALRGYIRLLALPNNRPTAQTVSLYKDGLGLAERPEEKRLALAGLSNVKDADALELASTYLDDQLLGTEAALAVVKIASPRRANDQPLRGEKVKAALQKVEETCKDETVRRQAKELLAKQ